MSGLDPEVTDLHPRCRQKNRWFRTCKITGPGLHKCSFDAVCRITATRTGEAFNPDLDIIRTKLIRWKMLTSKLVNRSAKRNCSPQRPGDGAYFRACHPKSVQTNLRWMKIS